MVRNFLLNLVVSLGLVFTAAVSQAEGIDYYFEILKDNGVNYEPDGQVCEQIAKLDLQQEFGDKFMIVSDIEYSIGGNTVGELDLLVVDKTSQKVVLLAEVKCWKNPKQGLRKALEQRRRFEAYLVKHHSRMQFVQPSEMNISVANFANDYSHRTISQTGGKEWGFDQEIGLNLRDLGKLRMMILRCQAFDGCKRPGY